METSPNQIYDKYINGRLDKSSTIDQLISIIENSNHAFIRAESLKILEKLGAKQNKVFHILENLLISDSNERVRNHAAHAIRTLFIDRAFDPMQWAYDHEPSAKCLVTIILSLGEIPTYKSKSFLLKKLSKIENPQFKKHLDYLFKSEKFNNYSNKHLAEILNNYIVVKYFEDRFSRIYYKIREGFVTELDLSSISSNVFGWNILKRLPEFISVLQKLTKIDLKINRISTLPYSLGYIVSLKYLDLSNNIIKRLPTSIGMLISLEYLYLRYNNLRTIPSSIGFLENLKVIDLRHNKINTLPNSLKKLSNLEVLDLHGNQIHTIPDSIGKLSSLKKLELGLNNIKEMPNWLQNLQALEILGLGGNKLLTKLPEWIVSFPSLSELSLYDNNLKKLPGSIGNLRSLEELTLRNNQIKDLPESLKNLQSLKRLNLSWNNFTSLPEWIGSLSSLEELNLWGNKLHSLPESLGSMKSLKILNLNFNRFIKEIPEPIRALQAEGLIVYK